MSRTPVPQGGKALGPAARTVAVPRELRDSLAADAEAARLFEGLAYSHRKEYGDWVGGAKKAETRAARAARAIEMIVERNRQQPVSRPGKVPDRNS